MNETDASAPRIVPGEWIDDNGHMNLACYVMAFDQDLDVFLDDGPGAAPNHSTSRNQGPFVVQSHIHYLDQLREGDEFRCNFLLLDGDVKRLHAAGTMVRERDSATVCVTEQILINVDHGTRRSKPYPKQVQTHIATLAKAHQSIDRPPQVGRKIGLKHA